MVNWFLCCSLVNQLKRYIMKRLKPFVFMFASQRLSALPRSVLFSWLTDSSFRQGLSLTLVWVVCTDTLHCFLAYWRAAGCLSVTDAAPFLKFGIPLTNCMPTGWICSRLGSEMPLHTNRPVNVEIQDTKGSPVFGGRHFLSYRPWRRTVLLRVCAVYQHKLSEFLGTSSVHLIFIKREWHLF
jgi:hypothetical protein